MSLRNWHAAYTGLIARLDSYGRDARWTLCGMGACVDAMLSLHDTVPTLLAWGDQEAGALGQELSRRAAAGIGGEIRVRWDAGPAWLDAAFSPEKGLGGTGPHAARALTALGAPALLALGHRDAEQMACLDGDIFLAEHGSPVRAADIVPGGMPRPKIYIFEFTAGRPVGGGGAVAPRSSRVIVRFTDPELEDDPEFERVSVALGARAGAGVLSGFNAIGGGNLDQALDHCRALALGWRNAAVPVVHLEMAGYDTPTLRDRVLEGLRGAVTSVGFSQSEYRALVPGAAPETATIIKTARRLQVDRLCIHADTWALAATRADPEQERDALMTGCLLASTRAARGRPARPEALPAGAVFQAPPVDGRSDDWSVVSCAAPYLPHPATTLGLGDTFLAGCLLVLGHPDRRETGEIPRGVA